MNNIVEHYTYIYVEIKELNKYIGHDFNRNLLRSNRKKKKIS